MKGEKPLFSRYDLAVYYSIVKANSMRNGLGRAASENAELAFSDGFAATDETDFKLIRYIIVWSGFQLT